MRKRKRGNKMKCFETTNEYKIFNDDIANDHHREIWFA